MIFVYSRNEDSKMIFYYSRFSAGKLHLFRDSNNLYLGADVAEQLSDNIFFIKYLSVSFHKNVKIIEHSYIGY